MSDRLLNTLQGANPVTTVALSSDGVHIVSVSGSYGRVKVWDLASGACVRTINNVGYVSTMAVGAHIVSGSSDNNVKLWDLASGVCVRTLDVGSIVNSVVTSQDGTRIVSGSYDYTVKLWDLATSKCVRTLEGHSGYVMSVALSTCGKHLVSGGYDHTIKVWDARHYRRVPHVLIRSRVRATLATPADGPLLERQLLHFVYCRNNPNLPSAEHGAVIPARAFRLVIKCLVG